MLSGNRRRKPTLTRRPPTAVRPSTPAARRAAKSVATPKRAAVFAVGSVLAVVLAMAVNPPTGSVHSFTAASDFRSEKDSGCTNSGAGCHGSETEYKDFNAYHPDADCLDCHEYEGVGCIPCHAPREHECALCHDGSMRNAPDRVRLTDPYPHGHYRETSHTVDAETMTRVVRVSPDGEASATCEQCHASDLRASHTAVPVVEGSEYGSDIGCGECHNDVRANGQAEVVSDWKARTCESCHKVNSSAPMHGIDELPAVKASDKGRCGGTGSGCHSTSDLHKLHTDAPDDCSGSAATDEPGCHDFEVEAHAPQARGCGGNSETDCHQGNGSDGYVHENMDAHEADVARASDTFHGATCGSCHAIAGGGTGLLALHGVSVEVPADSASCTGCHNGAASRAAVSAGDTSCESCHDGSGAEGFHAPDLEQLHQIEGGSEGCAGTGTGCHDAISLFSVGTGPGALHASCSACHTQGTATKAGYDAGKKTCGSSRACHDGGEFDPATGTHRLAGVAVGGTDERFHTAGLQQADARYTDGPSGVSTACSACHGRVLGTEHARVSSSLTGTNLCARCHGANANSAVVIKGGWAARNSSNACASCHDGSNGTPAPHAAIDTAHRGSEVATSGVTAAGACAKSGCHGSADLRVVHGDKGCAIAGCHVAVGDIRGTGITRCGGTGEQTCHAASTLHRSFDSSHTATEISRDGYAVAGTCAKAGCHATADVRALHANKKGCETDGCHVDGGPTTMSCGGPDGFAGSCHVASKRHTQIVPKHTAVELDRYDNPVPGSCVRAGCHATTNVRELHAAKGTCALAGCHVAGGPKVMTCGGSDASDGTSCHVASKRHLDYASKHAATELDKNGDPAPGSCVRAGCHATADVRTLHETNHCSNPGCHVEGGPTNMTCGGPDGNPLACHTVSQRHLTKDAKHIATQLDKDNNPLETSCVRAGCHATADVRTLHETNHCSNPGCHVEGGPTNMTCGGNDSATGSCHLASQRHTEKDAKHQATELNSSNVPTPGSCVRAGCHATADVRTLHETNHCSNPGCHVEGGPTNMTCGGNDSATGSCHLASQRHLSKDAKHQGVELNAAGDATEGACVTSGCHVTKDVRTLHDTTHCSTAGCHADGGPSGVSCGGAACHAGFSAGSHGVSHAADLVGTVNGISYGDGTNTGCLGSCHGTDLVAIHSSAMGSMEGGAATVCRVCHNGPEGSGSGAYASASSVVAAIANHDRRCTSCHQSGSNADTGAAVASPPSTCIPSLGMNASVEPVTTASIVSAIRTITESQTADVPTGGRDGDADNDPSTGSDRSTDPTSSPNGSGDPTSTADPSTQPTATPGPDTDGGDAGDPPSDPRPEPKPDPKPDPDVDCPATGSTTGSNAPDLSPDKLTKDACKKCHDVTEAPGETTEATQEDNR